ncbi:uncharacterized protein TNCV_2186431 [Trichonephila clavipes]|nr:uncharacterized protein TNCV_2186431 [Trichonephila clavipes]
MRHETSCKEMQAYTAEELQPTKWIVYKTVANGINTYEVNKVKDCDCPIRCHKCQICIHSLTCNCVDYAVRFTICKHIHYVCQKFPFMVANVSDETVLLVDEDSNRLRREKEKEAILKEKEKSVVHEEPTELVYEQVKRNMQLLNNVINIANAEQIKRIDQDVKNLLQFMGVSPFCSSLPKLVKKIKTARKEGVFTERCHRTITRQEDYNCEKRGSPYREMSPYHNSEMYKKLLIMPHIFIVKNCIVQPDIFCNYTFIMVFTVDEAITGINYLIASVFYQLYPPPASYIRNFKF